MSFANIHIISITRRTSLLGVNTALLLVLAAVTSSSNVLLGSSAQSQDSDACSSDDSASSNDDVSATDKGWKYAATHAVFEWQYYWMRSPNGYWAIVSVGTNPQGSDLLVISGAHDGTHTVRSYHGTLTAAPSGFSLQFNGGGATYRGSEEGGKERVRVQTPDFSLDATFSPHGVPLRHGDVRVNSLAVSPEYYSRSLRATGTMTIARHAITLDRAEAENDHQYGVVRPQDFSTLDTSLNHDWVYGTVRNANCNELTFVATKLRNPRGTDFANYLLVSDGDMVRRTDDVVITPEERFANGFSRSIRVTSGELAFDMVVAIPSASSSLMGKSILGGSMQEDGGALVTGTYGSEEYSGTGIKESTNKEVGFSGSSSSDQKLAETKAAYDSAKEDLKAAKATVKEVKAAVRAAKAAVKEAKATLKQENAVWKVAAKAQKKAKKEYDNHLALTTYSQAERGRLAEILAEANEQLEDAEDQRAEAVDAVATMKEELTDAQMTLQEANADMKVKQTASTNAKNAWDAVRRR